MNADSEPEALDPEPPASASWRALREHVGTGHVTALILTVIVVALLLAVWSKVDDLEDRIATAQSAIVDVRTR